MTKTQTGHLLIPTANGQRIEPATFVGNGLAVHKSLEADGYTITHVRSGLMLRGRLTRPRAFKAARELARVDWTFDKDAVTIEHSRRVREACGFPY